MGVNSLGWSVISDARILGMGVRIFPEGVVNLGQGEKELSKNAQRTQHRQQRRQLFRRKLRKQQLLKVLRQHGMAPGPEGFDKWVKVNPYDLRKNALHEKLSLLEIGRLLYHMNQRRGFQSNSRSVSKEDSTIFVTTEGVPGIKDTRAAIEAHPDETLGAMMNDLPADEPKRGRRTERAMYVAEFEKIWEEQAKHHDELTDELRQRIGGRKLDGYRDDGVLFFQRKLRSQKHTLGKCTFEPGKAKAPKSCLPFQYFRIHQFLNSVACNDEPLNDEERTRAVEYLLLKSKCTFKSLRRLWKKTDDAYRFNYLDKDRVTGSPTVAQLAHKEVFGKDWFKLSAHDQEQIWHIVHSFDNKDKLRVYATEKWKFTQQQADYLVDKVHFEPGYASLSRKAIGRILPWLEQGHVYSEAVTLAGVTKVLGKRWEALSEAERYTHTSAIQAISAKGEAGGYLQLLKNYLIEQFGVDESAPKGLYHHSAAVGEQQLLAAIPVDAATDRRIQDLRNPIVSRGLFELRKVVNALTERFGPFDQIRVELGRDLKRNKEQRLEVRRRQKDNERRNDEAVAELRKLNVRPSHETILKYKLWLECQRTCPYTGREIGAEDLFSHRVEIEHIIPWSRSLNDSFNNKTLCFADENARKGKRTPYEYYTEVGNWEEVKARALRLFHSSPDHPNRYRKFKQFVTKELPDDFISRQLNDTRYMSREAKKFLGMICRDVRVSPGQLTAKLRHLWGLNSLISSDDREKDRTDHRHHAVDALVVACTKERHLQQATKFNRYATTADNDAFPMPWVGFRSEAADHVAGILVSYYQNTQLLSTRTVVTRKKDKVYRNKGQAARAQLHKETVYGKRIHPILQESGYHHRKSLLDIKKQAHVDKIVDGTIQELIRARLRALGVDTSDKYDVPKGALVYRDETTKALRTHIFLPNKKGDPMPVFKVRLREVFNQALPLKPTINQHVNPSNNEHALVYVDKHGKWQTQTIKFLTAVQRLQGGEPIVQLPEDGEEIVTVLRIGDMYLLGCPVPEEQIEQTEPEVLSDYLYRIRSISDGDFEFWHHLAATKNFKSQLTRVNSMKKLAELRSIKVRLSRTGEIKLNV